MIDERFWLYKRDKYNNPRRNLCVMYNPFLSMTRPLTRVSDGRKSSFQLYERLFMHGVSLRAKSSWRKKYNNKENCEGMRSVKWRPVLLLTCVMCSIEFMEAASVGACCCCKAFLFFWGKDGRIYWTMTQVETWRLHESWSYNFHYTRVLVGWILCCSPSLFWPNLKLGGNAVGGSHRTRIT